MAKDAEAYRTIGEAAEELGLPQHVLRFWETRFSQISPMKRSGGRRYYRPADVQLLSAIRHLLYGEGYTIKGVQRLLKQQGASALIELVRQSQAADTPPAVHGAGPDASSGAPAVSRDPGGVAGLGASATAGGGHIEAPGPAQTPESVAGNRAEAAPGGDLPAQVRGQLAALLTELEECSRLLDQARNV